MKLAIYIVKCERSYCIQHQSIHLSIALWHSKHGTEATCRTGQLEGFEAWGQAARACRPTTSLFQLLEVQNWGRVRRPEKHIAGAIPAQRWAMNSRFDGVTFKCNGGAFPAKSLSAYDMIVCR